MLDRHSAKARSSDPSTSHGGADAANAVLSSLQNAVLAALAQGPRTTHELSELTGLTVVTVSPRIKPLRELGYVRDTMMRREKRSVWALTEAGAAYVIALVLPERTA